MENSQESGSLILEDFYPHFSFSMSSLRDYHSQVGDEELAPLHRKSSQSSKAKTRTLWQDIAVCPSQADPVLVLK